jgi:hypothetical protein
MPTAPTLERRRLEHRAGRIAHVIAALEDRVLYRETHHGTAPKPLKQAIGDFRLELARIRHRLRDLEP